MTLGLKFFSGVAKLIVFICTGTRELSITPDVKKKKKGESSFILHPFPSIPPQNEKQKESEKEKLC